MLLSSLLLSLDELNFYFTGKQDVIKDHTPARSITSSRLLHLGLFALLSFCNDELSVPLAWGNTSICESKPSHSSAYNHGSSNSLKCFQISYEKDEI